MRSGNHSVALWCYCRETKCRFEQKINNYGKVCVHAHSAVTLLEVSCDFLAETASVPVICAKSKRQLCVCAVGIVQAPTAIPSHSHGFEGDIFYTFESRRFFDVTIALLLYGFLCTFASSVFVFWIYGRHTPHTFRIPIGVRWHLSTYVVCTT